MTNQLMLCMHTLVKHLFCGISKKVYILVEMALNMLLLTFASHNILKRRDYEARS